VDAAEFLGLSFWRAPLRFSYSAIPEQIKSALVKRMSEKYLVPCIRPLNPPILGDFEFQNPLELGGRGAECNKVCYFSDILSGNPRTPYPLRQLPDIDKRSARN
jgi:hypothetical protein